MSRRAGLLLFAIALAIHLAVLVSYRTSPLFAWPVSDALAYERWAGRIVEGGLAAEPVFHQSPAYPVLLAALRALAGDAARTALLVVQALVSSLAIALLVPLAGLYLGSRRAGWLAGLVAMLHGPVVFYALKTLPVTMAMATQTAALVALGLAMRRPGHGPALGAGVLWGLACLTRAEMLLFVPLALIAVAGRREPGGRRWVRPTVLAAGVALALLPATIHNARQGDFVLIASAGGENLYAGNRHGARGGHTAIDPRAGDILSQRERATEIAERDAGRELRPSRVSAYWRDRAFGEIAEDPGRWVGLEWRKLLRILHPGDPTDLYSLALERSRHLTALRVLLLPVWTVLGLGLIGAWIAMRREPAAAWPLVAFAGVHVAVLLIFFVSSRLRMPLVFAAMPFAGYALEQGWLAWCKGRRAAVLAAIAVLSVLGTVSLVETARIPVREAVRLAAIHSSAGESEQALDVLRPFLERPDQPSAAERRGGHALAFDQAGWVYQKRGALGEAAEHYEQALALGLPEGREPATRTRLAQALEALRRIPEASRQHDAAVASEWADAGTLYERARFRLRRGDLRGARADLEVAVRLDPSWPAPRSLLSRLR